MWNAKLPIMNAGPPKVLITKVFSCLIYSQHAIELILESKEAYYCLLHCLDFAIRKVLIYIFI